MYVRRKETEHEVALVGKLLAFATLRNRTKRESCSVAAMCLLCPGDKLENLGANLDSKIAETISRLKAKPQQPLSTDDAVDHSADAGGERPDE